MAIFHQLAFGASLACTHRMQRAQERPRSKYPRVYPILRINTPIDQTDRTQTLLLNVLIRNPEQNETASEGTFDKSRGR